MNKKEFNFFVPYSNSGTCEILRLESTIGQLRNGSGINALLEANINPLCTVLDQSSMRTECIYLSALLGSTSKELREDHRIMDDLDG